MRAFSALSLSAVLVFAACSDDGGSQSDYVDGVREIRQIDFASDDEGQEFDPDLISREFEDLADRWDDLNPPDELRDAHDAWVEALREAAAAFDDVALEEDITADSDAADALRGVRSVGDDLDRELAAQFGFIFFRVDGASMEPTFHDDQALEPTNYTGLTIERGMTVVFEFHLDEDRHFIKRVIGLPGETVEVRDGSVFIDGVALVEDYILAKPNYTYGPKTVPADHYFVLGDNRHNSFDSHAWGNTCGLEQECDFVPQQNIIGVLAKDGKPLGE